MDKLLISNINLYKSFKIAPYSFSNALSEIIDNSLNIFKISNKLNAESFIIVYFNMDDNWIQVIDNGPGIVNHPNLKNLWLSIDAQDPFNRNLISGSFFLGNSVTIESKNSQVGFKTTLNLNSSVNEVEIKNYQANELMRTFPTGTRVTVDNIYFKPSLSELNLVWNNLAFIFKNVIEETKVNIIFAAIKNGTIFDLSTTQPQAVNNLPDVSKMNFRLPEFNNTKTVSFNSNLQLSDRQVKITGNAYQMLLDKSFGGISFANVNKTIIGSIHNLYKPNWFNESYANVYVDVTINGLECDLFNSKFIISEQDQRVIDSFIEEQVSSLKRVLPKTMTKPLVDSSDEKYKTKNMDEVNWNKTKEFLTKVFSETGTISAIDDFEIVKDKLRFTYNADDGKKITINLIKSKQRDIKDEWLQLIPISEEPVEQIYEYDLKVNLNHPYFIDFLNYSDISSKLEHFFICYGIAECIARLDGASVTQLKYEINKLLRGNNDN